MKPICTAGFSVRMSPAFCAGCAVSVKFTAPGPNLFCCSATIANPGEHAEKLVGLPFPVVDNDGSPHGGKDFVFWNPPLTG